MSGVAIINYLLSNDAGVIGTVPASRIFSGVIPLSTAMPAISVMQISGRQHNNVAMASDSYLVTDRVQVTVLSKSYAQAKAILSLVRAACPLSRGTINGFASEGVIPDAEGPDMFDEVDEIYQQSHDYMVSYIR